MQEPNGTDRLRGQWLAWTGLFDRSRQTDGLRMSRFRNFLSKLLGQPSPADVDYAHNLSGLNRHLQKKRNEQIIIIN